jgi:hypothetical protein
MVIIAGASAVLAITGAVKWLLLFKDCAKPLPDSKSTISNTTKRIGYWVFKNRIAITVYGYGLLPVVAVIFYADVAAIIFSLQQRYSGEFFMEPAVARNWTSVASHPSAIVILLGSSGFKINFSKAVQSLPFVARKKYKS